MQPCNLTTLDILTVTYSEDSIYNNKAKVVFSDLESSKGIFHEIDTVPPFPDSERNKTAHRVTSQKWSTSMASRHSTSSLRYVEVGDGPSSSACHLVHAHGRSNPELFNFCIRKRVCESPK